LDIWELARELYSRNINIFIEWVPGHTEVLGNDKADSLAKEAAKKLVTSPYTSYSFLKRNIRQHSLIEWQDQWQKTRPRPNYANELNLKRNKLLQGYPSRVNSSITQLRTGHGYFNNYLFKIPNSGVLNEYCNCRQASQTPKHLLIGCKIYKKERAELRKKLKTLPFNFTTILFTNIGLKYLEGFLINTQIATRPNSSIQQNSSLAIGWGRIAQ
jgi:RNase H